MFVVSIDAEACTGCGQCASSCPAQIITMVDQESQVTAAGAETHVKKAQVTGEGDECLGCESCAIVCDVGGVTVQEY